MGAKLFVRNLSWDVTEDVLRETFEAAGTVVSATIITERMSGRSKGFGFVEMGNDEEAQNAIDTLNEKELDGRKIIVDKARPRKEEH